jgi:hypothetical protein
MYYTGIDLHKKTSFITTVDQKGKIVARANLPNVKKNILDYFVTLEEETQIVIESMASRHWLYDVLSVHHFNVVVSNHLKTKAIASAKIKNDKVDSHMLAQLLRAHLIATVHVSSLKTRKLKELLRHRQRLVRDATRMKNRIHMVLMKNNISIPVSDLFGAYSDETDHLFRSKSSGCSEVNRPLNRSEATVDFFYFSEAELLVKRERSFLMDSPFRLILYAL